MEWNRAIGTKEEASNNKVSSSYRVLSVASVHWCIFLGAFAELRKAS